jgi:hypothetical protein
VKKAERLISTMTFLVSLEFCILFEDVKKAENEFLLLTWKYYPKIEYSSHLHQKYKSGMCS